jgi:excisionase family DNA binding protein
MDTQSITLPADGLATVKEASRFLNVSPAMIYKMAANGSLPSVRIGTSVRIPRQALAKLYNAEQPVP